MSAPTSPGERTFPHRTLTQNTAPTAASDDEVIPDSDSSETTDILLERLRAWKHMCGYLEEYVSVTAKAVKSQSKDYEKVLKTVSDPLREGHHFTQNVGGVSSFFENLRANTQGMINGFLETEKNLKGSVLPMLARLHKEIKNKGKEVKSGTSKGAKAVDKARVATQKHIDVLGQHCAHFDGAAGNKVEVANDPYVLLRGVNYRLNKQVVEENNNRQDILSVQNSFRQFEGHVIQTVQHALDQFFQLMSGQMDRQRAMYADILSNVQTIPLEFEWVNFVQRNDHILVNPDSPPRSFSNISFPNQAHRATKALIEGTLERKSRTVIKGYSSGYYVVTPAGYLHEYKDNDDFRRDPSPDLSLYLPDCVIGNLDGVKFNVKGKDVSGGKVGSAFHTSTDLSFKASSHSEAETWWKVIKNATQGPEATHAATAAAAQPQSPPLSPQAESEKKPEDAAPAAAGRAAAGDSAIDEKRSGGMTTTTAAPPAPAGDVQPGKSKAVLKRNPSSRSTSFYSSSGRMGEKS